MRMFTAIHALRSNILKMGLFLKWKKIVKTDARHEYFLDTEVF